MPTHSHLTENSRPASTGDTCVCEIPVLRERGLHKGISETWCGRCGKPVPLTLAKRNA